ncbi:MAG: ATP-binding cassette domain-containing protein, partial [Clostridium sp.]|nr:ATP-binding cassette domain-containing protein [Clostridium sp.]
MPTIHIKNVSKVYEGEDGTPVQALEHIHLDIEDGEFVCIVGPSGCGKSTLLEIVAGLQKQSGGTVFLDDTPVTGPGRDIGVVFQDAALFPWRTIRRNILYGMETAGIPKKEQEERLAYYLKLMGLEGFENKYPSQLSGGM